MRAGVAAEADCAQFPLWVVHLPESAAANPVLGWLQSEAYLGVVSFGGVSLQLSLILATFSIRMAAAWMALRLYRRSRELRFAIVTFALAVSALIPFFDLVNPPQDFVGEWLPSVAGGLAVLLMAVILVRTLTELSQKFDEVRVAHDALEQRVAERTAALQQANSSLENEVVERKRVESALRTSEASLKQKQAELEKLAGKLIAAQEDERRRLARELHDHLSQSLAALALELANVQRGSDGEPAKLRSGLRHIEGSVHKLADDIHDMSRLLHPSILDDLGLEAAVRADCARFSERERIAVRVDSHDVPAKLPPDVALSLYRITQESLHNVAKHAGARRATVTILGEEDAVRLIVEDSGVGFDSDRVKDKSGLGLISMSERVRLLEGTLEVRSEPGFGTRIEVTAPIERRLHEQAASLAS